MCASTTPVSGSRTACSKYHKFSQSRKKSGRVLFFSKHTSELREGALEKAQKKKVPMSSGLMR